MVRRQMQPRVGGQARCWVEIDLAAVEHNVRAWIGMLRPGSSLTAVVKSDAYGHGMLDVARTAVTAGAARLAVANAAEGAVLRKAGFRCPVMVVGPSLEADAVLLAAHDLLPAVMDHRLAAALAAVRPGMEVQVEVDTGMTRHGVEAAVAADFVLALQRTHGLRVVSLFTHFAAMGPDDVESVHAQWCAFREVLQSLRRAGVEVAHHACNSLGAHLLPDAHGAAVRIGGGLHGLVAREIRERLGLRRTLSLKTTVAALRRVAAGTPVGYGSMHVCARDSLLALLPCGYADGLHRANWSDGDVLVHGRRAPIVGLVSMNQVVVDCTEVPEVGVGDEVVLVGAQGDVALEAEERCRHGTSPYEVCTSLHPSLPRVRLGVVGATRLSRARLGADPAGAAVSRSEGSKN